MVRFPALLRRLADLSGIPVGFVSHDNCAHERELMPPLDLGSIRLIPSAGQDLRPYLKVARRLTGAAGGEWRCQSVSADLAPLRRRA